jgi:hypothetical protein
LKQDLKELAMSQQQIAALIRERAGLKSRGLTDRVKQVDEQLRLLGAKGVTPAKRAEKRVPKKARK